MQALVITAAALCWGGCRADAPKVSDPFVYEGMGAPQWTGHRRTAEFVAMPDGVKIAVDILLPTGYTGDGPAASRFPVILQYTPYGRSGIDLKTGQVVVSATAKFFLSYGYAYVSADMRGTGGSEGWNNVMDRSVRRDGKAIVDWIEAQPWSDGNVGMTGGSYVGWSQFAVASMKPKALKAIVPSVAAWDGFLFRPGGIYSEAFMQMWSALTHSLNRSVTFRSFPIPPTPPVVDEDGDGELLDEIPVDLDNDGWVDDDYRWPLDRGPPPRYPDNVKRARHSYLSTIMQHAAHPDGAPGTFDFYSSLHPMRFWDSKRPGDGLTAPDLNWAWFKDVAESNVAVLHLAGWFDPFVEAGFQLHTTLGGRLPTRLIARPQYHQGISPANARAIGIDSTEASLNQTRLLNEQLRWYDRWLKGIENGIDRAPSTVVFVMNEGWREERSWPPAGAAPMKLYLETGRALAPAARAAGSDEYKADFAHGSGWGPPQDVAEILRATAMLGRPAPTASTYFRNRQFMFVPPNTPPIRTEMDRGTLTYTTPPLESDTRVLGHPIVHLWASSTADDGDFYFYLEDVAPDGTAILVTEFQHRAGFDTLMDNDQLIPGNPGIDIKPDLPWHGFRQADYDEKVFAGGRVAEIVTALYPTGWLFKKGHSIRLAIAAADWPAFELHPKLAPTNRPDGPGTVIPTVTVYRGEGRASYIELPIVR